MEATEAEVQATLDSLKRRNLVIESSGSRVARYSQNVEPVLKVPSQSVAILTVLMLRGPQTPGELRINCERLHRFADISAVEAFLQELAARPAGALVVQLARLPGARENRWAHLLAGHPQTPSTTKLSLSRRNSKKPGSKSRAARIRGSGAARGRWTSYVCNSRRRARVRCAGADVGHPFSLGPVQDLRLRLRGAEARQPRHPPRRDLRAARPERRGQDHAHQHRLRHRQAELGTRHRRRPRHRRATTARRAR